ncbi:MAG: class I SAM-dependent methyltransferase [Opitutaceae bacterium]|nr:class I SAM-dependent methyltransferase [Opitutaceae bacterium]
MSTHTCCKGIHNWRIKYSDFRHLDIYLLRLLFNRIHQPNFIRCFWIFNGDCTWLQTDVIDLPPTLHARGDLVVCSNVITFVSAPACARAMREVTRCARPGGALLFILPALESHDAVVALETGRKPPVRGATAIVARDDRKQRFYTAAGARQLATRAGLRSITVRKAWYPWIDEGITRAPRGHELPWDWLVTARR